MYYLDGKIPVWGVHEDNTLTQIRECAKIMERVALSADGHCGYGAPIGGILASETKISPTAVGYDIGCGNEAVRLDVSPDYVRANIDKIMDEIFSTISFGVGRNANEKVDFDKLSDHVGWRTDATKSLRQKAENQFSTVGSGNHFIDIFVDELDRVWIGVHFGSRGLGHGIATWFFKACNAQDGMMVPPVAIEASSDLGAQYIDAMQLGGLYAYEGRDWVCKRVAKILGGEILETVANHHNYAWLEEHEGKKMWVCRKGATPAFPGQRGFVGGTMGETSVILEGVDCDEAKVALYSTVHGAGRVMGRMQAKGTVDKKTGAVKREGLVKPEMMKEWMTKSKVTLRGGGVDESPHCYKRLDEVLSAHAGSIRVQHVLTPLGVAMAGEKEFDPYKD